MTDLTTTVVYESLLYETPKRTDAYDRYRLRIESELRALWAINKSVVSESVRIVFDKHCGDFTKPPDFEFRNNI